MASPSAVHFCPKCGKAVTPPATPPPAAGGGTPAGNSAGSTTPSTTPPDASSQPSGPPTNFKSGFEKCFAQVLEPGRFTGNYEALFSEQEKTELMAYFANYNLPDKPPSVFKNMRLTRSQKILMAGVMHVRDQRMEPGKWGSKPGHWPNEQQRVARANCCGHWAKRVWEYSGIRTSHSWDAKWKRYLPWKEAKEQWKRRWTPFDFKGGPGPQMEAIKFEDYKAIQPGDYLCCKWRRSRTGSNHAFLFIKWLNGNENSKRRKALIMDQSNNKVGGGKIRNLNMSCDPTKTPYLYARRTPKPPTAAPA